MTEYKDKKYSLIWHLDSKDEFGTKIFLKMERKLWCGFFHEKNVVRLWAAVSLGKRCVTSQELAAKKTTVKGERNKT